MINHGKLLIYQPRITRKKECWQRGGEKTFGYHILVAGPTGRLFGFRVVAGAYQQPVHIALRLRTAQMTLHL